MLVELNEKQVDLLKKLVVKEKEVLEDVLNVRYQIAADIGRYKGKFYDQDEREAEIKFCMNLHDKLKEVKNVS